LHCKKIGEVRFPGAQSPTLLSPILLLRSYKEVKEAREQKREAQKRYWRGGPKRLKKLRVRAPWNQEYPDLALTDSSNADH